MDIFAKVSESKITRAIARSFFKELDDHADTDVIIIGAGPSGLMAARDLASADIRTLIVERNNYLGGGFWIGGYLMNKLTVRAPGEKVLEELGIPCEKADEGLFVADGPHACSKLIAAACDAGAKVLNMTSFEDVVLRENDRVEGVVINWSPVQALPRQITCVDPVSLECKVVIDATGHDALVVKKLEERGVVRAAGMGAMWVERSEDQIVERTGKLIDGLIVAGMAVSTTFGVPRMGPTFGGMLLSGRKAAIQAIQMLKEQKERERAKDLATV